MTREGHVRFCEGPGVKFLGLLGSRTSLVLFWTAVLVVILVALFPQLIATLIAG
jgi:hypothetical protein